MNTSYHYPESGLTSNQAEINTLQAIFIAAPREMSAERFRQIVKHYLPKANLILGVSTETHVVGFEDQLQFKMLDLSVVQPIIDRVVASPSPNKIYTLEYSQAELENILREYSFKRVLLVNGSWKYAFHNLPAYQVLIESKTPFKFISPFVDEAEAKNYETTHTQTVDLPSGDDLLSASEMLELASRVATQSYDYSFQTGAVIGEKQGDKYKFIASGFNKVIPYQSYALHHGNSRERNQSKPHDTNHYDTIHAEMMILTDALSRGIDLAGKTLFVNLLPCPNCARTLSQTDILELVYAFDHSDGYAAKLFEQAGKEVVQKNSR